MCKNSVTCNCISGYARDELKQGYAYTFPFDNEVLYYSTCKSATNEVIRLYKGYNMPLIKKQKVLKGKDRFGIFFFPIPETLI